MEKRRDGGKDGGSRMKPFDVSIIQPPIAFANIGMSCPSWQWHRIGSRWSPVRSLPVAPLWCDLVFFPTVVVIKLRRTSALVFQPNFKKKIANRAPKDTLNSAQHCFRLLLTISNEV